MYGPNLMQPPQDGKLLVGAQTLLFAFKIIFYSLPHTPSVFLDAECLSDKDGDCFSVPTMPELLPST